MDLFSCRSARAGSFEVAFTSAGRLRPSFRPGARSRSESFTAGNLSSALVKKSTKTGGSLYPPSRAEHFAFGRQARHRRDWSLSLASFSNRTLFSSGQLFALIGA